MNELFPPASLEAKTKKELRELMIALNRKFGRNFRFFDFQYAKGKWHCWFQLSATDEAEMIMNEKAKNVEQ